MSASDFVTCIAESVRLAAPENHATAENVTDTGGEQDWRARYPEVLAKDLMNTRARVMKPKQVTFATGAMYPENPIWPALDPELGARVCKGTERLVWECTPAWITARHRRASVSARMFSAVTHLVFGNIDPVTRRFVPAPLACQVQVLRDAELIYHHVSSLTLVPPFPGEEGDPIMVGETCDDTPDPVRHSIVDFTYGPVPHHQWGPISPERREPVCGRLACHAFCSRKMDLDILLPLIDADGMSLPTHVQVWGVLLECEETLAHWKRDLGVLPYVPLFAFHSQRPNRPRPISDGVVNPPEKTDRSTPFLTEMLKFVFEFQAEKGFAPKDPVKAYFGTAAEPHVTQVRLAGAPLKDYIERPKSPEVQTSLDVVGDAVSASPVVSRNPFFPADHPIEAEGENVSDLVSVAAAPPADAQIVSKETAEIEESRLMTSPSSSDIRSSSWWPWG